MTPRWGCEECGAPVRLYFEPQAADVDPEEGGQVYVCRLILCNAGHPIPSEFAAIMMDSAAEEFQAAFERGYKTAEVLVVPGHEETMETEASGEWNG